MDQDELLAKQLQMEEFQQQKFSGTNFQSQITSSVQKVMKYEDPVCQAQALSVIPKDEILEDAQEMVEINYEFGEDTDMDKEDYVAQALLKWFKSYFSWVDQPACEHCNHKKTMGAGITVANNSEKQYDCSRVELYQCAQCHQINRFPRYNDPGKLLTTRRGRCGEWANAFTLCCRAMELKARFVLDWTDHVWTEYYSHKKQRWVHLDPCECSYDQPLLYESGWGKKLDYAIGFSIYGAKDVTKRYTRKWEQVFHRRVQVNEEWLRDYLNQITKDIRLSLDAEDQVEAQRMEQAETQELESMQGRPLSQEEQTLPGRSTGSEEWRAQRGETGKNFPKKIKNFTSYRFCKSEGSSNVDRVKGGAVRASGENAPNELAINLFDGQNSTKWLDFGGGGQSGSAWVEYRLRDSAKEVVIVNYNVVSANDSPERDPCDWSLFTISSDSQGNEVQQEIDCQSGIHFQNRYELKSFNVTKKLPARRWQFVISRTREPQSANSVQISRLEYFCDQSSIKNDSKELSLEEIVKNEFNKLILQGKEPNEAAAEALAVAQQKLQT
eukprot:TRINITY_DN4355_c0_g2_i2.p1 TRINITY_DN4355_c0_g2~~TRINITY_DN4355_c0_g2_i2.p1  ORF type:complete len:640 (-),score=45.23 TRINITY_DN4355_c0_g2_i2:272-1933(-)